MTNEEDRTRDQLMDARAVEDAVLEYLYGNPELIEDVAPERDLWPEIESRIGARILPLTTAAAISTDATSRTFNAAKRQRQLRTQLHWTSWTPMAAAAALLIAATSGVTYVLTKHSDTAARLQNRTVVTATQVPIDPTRQSEAPQLPTQNVRSSPLPASDNENAPRVATTERTVPQHGAASRSTLPSTQLVSRDADPDVRQTYNEEITTLRAELDARRAQLDPTTVATIERNLRIIDDAIAQARAALIKDPKSRFLDSQLDRSLAKKTDLLRAAALLPSV